MKTNLDTSVSSSVDNSQHTPGPWTACCYRPEDRRFPHVHIGSHKKFDGKCTEYMVVNSVSGEQTEGCFEANARLIASAPDLLAALQRLVDAYDADIEYGLVLIGGNTTAINHARAVIAKARSTE